MSSRTLPCNVSYAFDDEGCSVEYGFTLTRLAKYRCRCFFSLLLGTSKISDYAFGNGYT